MRSIQWCVVCNKRQAESKPRAATEYSVMKGKWSPVIGETLSLDNLPQSIKLLCKWQQLTCHGWGLEVYQFDNEDMKMFNSFKNESLTFKYSCFSPRETSESRLPAGSPNKEKIAIFVTQEAGKGDQASRLEFCCFRSHI